MLWRLGFILLIVLLTCAAAMGKWRHRWPGPPPHALEKWRQVKQQHDAPVLDQVLPAGAPAVASVDEMTAAAAARSGGGASFAINWPAIELKVPEARKRQGWEPPIPVAGRRLGDVLADARQRLPWGTHLAIRAEPTVNRVTVTTKEDEDAHDAGTVVIDTRDVLLHGAEGAWPVRMRTRLGFGPASNAGPTMSAQAAFLKDLDDRLRAVAPQTGPYHTQMLNGQMVLTAPRETLAAGDDVIWRMRTEALAADLLWTGLAGGVVGGLLLVVHMWLRRHTLARADCCPACGYDLRYSPDRCPECGQPALKAERRHFA